MKFSSFYPVIGSQDVAGTADFYKRHFEFEVTFEADFYVSLRSLSDPMAELAIVDYTHPSVPRDFGKPVQGLILNFEVENVDAEYQRLSDAGLPIDLKIKDEDWGQRHFLTHDPNGVLIDVIRTTKPSEEFEQNYT